MRRRVKPQVEMRERALTMGRMGMMVRARKARRRAGMRR